MASAPGEPQQLQGGLQAQKSQGPLWSSTALLGFLWVTVCHLASVRSLFIPTMSI